MHKINRNAPCPCGSGLKYKKCCGAKEKSRLEGLSPGIRMKGGVRYDEDVRGFVAIVHTWDNVYCNGEPTEWRAQDVFPTEDEAMRYYKSYIRPNLQKMMSELKDEKSNSNIFHRKLE